jgi:hypothetical protein
MNKLRFIKSWSFAQGRGQIINPVSSLLNMSLYCAFVYINHFSLMGFSSSFLTYGVTLSDVWRFFQPWTCFCVHVVGDIPIYNVCRLVTCPRGREEWPMGWRVHVVCRSSFCSPNNSSDSIQVPVSPVAITSLMSESLSCLGRMDICS